MNIIEAEDIVKGLPDQVLFQEAQYPSGQIPQYLAVSEVQRRQEMRQRFQSQQQGQQPTVKDQILQGGIAAAGPPPQISQPPMAAPAENMQTAMYDGGITRMFSGGYTPGGTVKMQVGRSTDVYKFENLSPEARQTIVRQYAALGINPRLVMNPEGFNSQPFEKRRKVFEQLSALVPTPAQEQPKAPAPDTSAFKQSLGSGIAGVVPPTNQTITGIIPPSGAAGAPAVARTGRGASGSFGEPTNPPAVTVQAPATTTATPPAADSTQVSAPPVTPGGIGDIKTDQDFDIQKTLIKFLNQPRTIHPDVIHPDVQAAIDQLKANQAAGLPAPISMAPYVEAAEKRQQQAREDARKEAIASTLMNLGAGLVSGDPAAGLQRATQVATETMREGRRQAEAEGRMAEQLRLQQAQQERQNIIDTMKFKSDSVNAIANIIAGEDKATRSDKLQAAQILATYDANIKRTEADLAESGRVSERERMRAQVSAIEKATDVYTANPANGLKPADQQSREIMAIARTLNPYVFGNETPNKGSSNTSTPTSAGSRFKVSQVPGK